MAVQDIIVGGGRLYLFAENVSFPNLDDVANLAAINVTGLTEQIIYDECKFSVDFDAEMIRECYAAADTDMIKTGVKATLEVKIKERDAGAFGFALGMSPAVTAAGADQAGKEVIDIAAGTTTYKRALFLADAPFTGGYMALKLWRVAADPKTEILFDNKTNTRTVKLNCFQTSNGLVEIWEQTAAPTS